MISENETTKDNMLPEQQTPGLFGRVWRGLKGYLTDWRNLLGHALLGVVFLVVAIWAPVNIWIKLAVIAGLITFNIFRMRKKSAKNDQNNQEVAEDELI